MPALLFGCIARPTIITSTVVALVAKLIITPMVYAQVWSLQNVFESLAWVLLIFLLASLKWALLRQFTSQEARAKVLMEQSDDLVSDCPPSCGVLVLSNETHDVLLRSKILPEKLLGSSDDQTIANKLKKSGG